MSVLLNIHSLAIEMWDLNDESPNEPLTDAMLAEAQSLLNVRFPFASPEKRWFNHWRLPGNVK
jgi:hypothetical protein